MGAYKRYCEFGSKEQRAELRVREFRKFGTTNLRGITVLIVQMLIMLNKTKDWALVLNAALVGVEVGLA